MMSNVVPFTGRRAGVAPLTVVAANASATAVPDFVVCQIALRPQAWSMFVVARSDDQGRPTHLSSASGVALPIKSVCVGVHHVVRGDTIKEVAAVLRQCPSVWTSFAALQNWLAPLRVSS